MLFNTFEFLWLFPLIFLVYYASMQVNRYDKLGNVVLLLISYGLYLRWKPLYALVLLWVILVTYGAALGIGALTGG